jgi:hypothetical protein
VTSSSTEPPEQKEVGPLAAMTGVPGVSIVTSFGADVELQLPSVTVTVKCTLPFTEYVFMRV